MANFSVRRGTQDEIDATPIVDGQLFFNTTSNKIEMDYIDERRQYGGDTTVDVTISSSSTNPVQSKAILNALNTKVGKDEIVDDLPTAIATVSDDIPVGCKTISQFNNRFVANEKTFIFDYQDGLYGWNESPARGADTFHPFKSQNYISIYNHEITSSNEIDIDCTFLHGWNKLVVNDFNIVVTAIRVKFNDKSNSYSTEATHNISRVYDATNGILKITYNPVWINNSNYELYAYPTIDVLVSQ